MEETPAGVQGRPLRLPKIKGLAHFDAVSLLCNLVDPVDSSKTGNNRTGPSKAGSYDDSLLPGNDLVTLVPNFTADIGGPPCDASRDHVRWQSVNPCEDGHCQSRNKERSAFVPASCTGVLLETPIQHQLLDRQDLEREHGCNISVVREQRRLSCSKPGPHRTEHVDLGAYYYRQFFYDNEHQNFFGMDENLGPVAISLKRDFIVSDGSSMSPTVLAGGRSQFSFSEPLSSLSSPVLNNCTPLSADDICPLYRIVVRTSRLEPLRVSVLEECMAEPRMRGSSTSVAITSTVGSTALPARDVIAYALPTVQLSCLRAARADQKVYDSLMRLDEQNICRQVKAGIMYCTAGQSSEEDMYNNVHGSSLFNAFLECLGSTVPLKGFTKYRAQLDNKNDTTGTHSVYTEYNGNELMFHVSTLLPHTEGKKQQLLRKRHIGNDILTIVFQESDAQPFAPTVIRSQFQHVFIIVRHVPKLETSASGPMFQVAVTHSSSIPNTPPAIPQCPIFPLSSELREFVLAKLVNLENAAHRSAKFLAMAMRTRHEWLVDLVENYTTTHQLDPQSSAHPWGRFTHAFKGKRGKSHLVALRPALASDSRLLGGIAWPVQVSCWGKGMESHPDEYTLCISSRFLCVLCEKSQQLLLFIAVDGVIGWTMSVGRGRMCIYYGAGECLQFNLVCSDDESSTGDVQELATRLAQFSEGSLCQEIVLHRSANNHLGFILLGGGTVGEVDPYGVAWKCGVRQNSRVLEINGKPLCGKLMKDVVSQLREKSVTLLLVPPFAAAGSRTRPLAINNDELTTTSTSSLHGTYPGFAVASTPLQDSHEVYGSPDNSNADLLPGLASTPETLASSPSSPLSSLPLLPQNSNSLAMDVARPRAESLKTPPSTSKGKSSELCDVRGRTRQLPGTQPVSTPCSVSDVQSPMFKGIVAKAKASLAASVAAKTTPTRETRSLGHRNLEAFSPPMKMGSLSPTRKRSFSDVSAVANARLHQNGRKVVSLSPPPAMSPLSEMPYNGPVIGSHYTARDSLSDESLDVSDTDYHPAISVFDLPENASADELRQVLVRTQSELLRCQHKLAALRKENISLVRVVETMRADGTSRGR